MHAVTGEVFLLWVRADDLTLPVEWQTARYLRGADLDAFLAEQCRLYM
jgi:hypothetical protein